MQIDRNLAETHYAEHKERPFFGELTTYITSGPVVAMVIGGESAISMIRTLCGATKADQAAPGTIRGDYALVTGMNIIHASDSPESASREIGLFFKENEILSYEDTNARWTY
jgi:nucleoside-diphosphate kinase